MYDAIIVGGGIVGMSTAYHLARENARVLLCDRRDEGRATDAGAGILSFETYSGDSTGWFPLVMAASGHYPAMIETLGAEQGGDTGYAVCGKLTVAVSDDEIAAFSAVRAHLLSRQQQQGIPAAEDFYEISAAEARTLFPPLGQVRGALYYGRAARVDGRLLNRALQQAAQAHGLKIQETGVDRLVVEGNAVTGVVADGVTCHADAVIIAGGAWSQAFGDQLGVQIPIAPQRGQIIHLDLRGVDTGAWPVITAFRDHYMVPWPDSRVACGATWEAGAGFHPHITAAGVHEVLEEALRVAPGLAGAGIREMRVGLRPLAGDGMPIVGPVPGVDGVFVAAGHAGGGLQTGPYSGKIIADLVLGKEPEIDIAPFSLARFTL